MRNNSSSLVAAACVASGFLVGTSPTTARAQLTEERQILAAQPNGSVKISNPVGSVRVIGWGADSVKVESTGRVSRTTRIRFDVEGRETHIRVTTADDTPARVVGLVVHVPSGSHVAVRTRSGDVVVEHVSGASDIQTTTGGIRTVGALGHLYAQTATGDITTESWTKSLRAHSMDGSITVAEARGFVEVRSVSGHVRLHARNIWEGTVASVTGNIDFTGSFDPDGSFTFETHSGTTTLALMPETRATIDVAATANVTRNDFAPLEARTFTVGRAGARVAIRTFRGRVALHRADPERADGSTTIGSTRTPGGGSQSIGRESELVSHSYPDPIAKREQNLRLQPASR